MISAKMVPKYRHETYEWARDKAPRLFHSMLTNPRLRTDFSIPPWLEGQPEIVQAQGIADDEAARLKLADNYYVTDDMTAMCLAAAKTLPTYSLRHSDLPSEHGFIVWERPIANAQQKDWISAERSHIPVFAASWGHVGNGVWASFYSDTSAAIQAWMDMGIVSEEEARDSANNLFGPLMYEREMALLYHDKGYWSVEDAQKAHEADPEQAHVVIDSDHPEAAESEHLRRVLLTTWHLMRQQISASETGYPERQWRRRMERKHGAAAKPFVSGVRVVTLRRKAHAGSEPSGESGRKYTKRWVVAAHWRNQWYPSREEHELKLIVDYVKGPEGAPFVGGERVNVLRR